MVELARCLGEAGIHAGDGAPVGLLAARLRGVFGPVGERFERGAHPHEPRGERQLAAELMQFVEVEAERAGALQAHRLVEHVGCDVRVAVAVAADPRADAQERGHARASPRGIEGVERVLDRRVEPGRLAEEGVVVIGEAVGDLVDDQEPLLAQHGGSPENEHRAPELVLDRRELAGIARGAVALVEEAGDLELACQRGLAPDLGRVSGEHRAHQRAVEDVAESLRRDARTARVLERIGERARARRGAGLHVGAVAPDVVLVLGDVGEMGEVAEGAHDRERLIGGETVERRLELAPGAGLVVAMEADRRLPDLLDERVGLLALLLAHRVAEDAPEQAYVVAQRPVLFGVVVEARVNSHARGLRGGGRDVARCSRTSQERRQTSRRAVFAEAFSRPCHLLCAAGRPETLNL